MGYIVRIKKRRLCGEYSRQNKELIINQWDVGILDIYE